jgi:hypothetical protein
MEKTIYMPLMGEGTECWRPVRAVKVADDVFEIAEEVPEGESWPFAGFSRVRCKEKLFTDGQSGLVVFAYAVESHPFYRLLKDYEGRVFRIVLTDGEEARVRVTHIDEEHEDFVYDLLSTNRDIKYRSAPKKSAFVAKFENLISAQLEG